MGMAEHLTDEQWLALMEIVNDEHDRVIQFPEEPGKPAVVQDGGLRILIQADGTRKDFP